LQRSAVEGNKDGVIINCHMMTEIHVKEIKLQQLRMVKSLFC